MNPVTAVAPPAGWLARPGQESADLGGLLYAFRRAGTGLALLCLTRGEASPLNSTRAARLEAVRPWELQLAAGILGISQVTVTSYPDGGLGWRPEAELSEKIGRAVRQYSADLLLIIDPATGDREEGAIATESKARYTYTDLERFPADNLRREIIDGDLIVTASPVTRHQRVVTSSWQSKG